MLIIYLTTTKIIRGRKTITVGGKNTTSKADENGYAAIIKNSKISYVLLPYDKVKTEEILRGEDMEEVARRLIEKIKDEYNIQLKLNIE